MTIENNNNKNKKNIISFIKHSNTTTNKNNYRNEFTIKSRNIAENNCKTMKNSYEIIKDGKHGNNKVFTELIVIKEKITNVLNTYKEMHVINIEK